MSTLPSPSPNHPSLKCLGCMYHARKRMCSYNNTIVLVLCSRMYRPASALSHTIRFKYVLASNKAEVRSTFCTIPRHAIVLIHSLSSLFASVARFPMVRSVKSMSQQAPGAGPGHASASLLLDHDNTLFLKSIESQADVSWTQ